MNYWWIIVVLFFLLILILPLLFKVYFSYNPHKNLGMVIIRFWFIKIQYFTFVLKHSGIIIRTKKERKQMEYKFSDPKFRFFEIFTFQIKKKIRVKYIDIYSNIGTGDASTSAILSGTFNILYKMLLGYIKNLKPKCVVDINSHSSFDKKIFIVSFYGKISISIIEVIYCFIVALIKNKK